MSYPHGKLAELLTILLPTIICSVVIWKASGIFHIVEFDSGEYIDFSAHRTAAYPIIVRSLTTLFQSAYAVILFQIIIYLVSFVILLLCVQRRAQSVFITGSLGLTLSLNIYLQAYHTTILTESIAFTLSNLCAAILISDWQTGNRNRVLCFGLCIGLLIALKPAFISHGLAAFIIVFISNVGSRLGSGRALVAFACGMFAVLAV